MRQDEAFPAIAMASSEEWRRRSLAAAAEADRLRVVATRAERSILELLALITMTGEVHWSPDLPEDDITGGTVSRAGATLDALRDALGIPK